MNPEAIIFKILIPVVGMLLGAVIVLFIALLRQRSIGLRLALIEQQLEQLKEQLGKLRNGVLNEVFARIHEMELAVAKLTAKVCRQ